MNKIRKYNCIEKLIRNRVALLTSRSRELLVNQTTQLRTTSKVGFSREDIGVIYNINDQQSTQTKDHYKTRHNIPETNIIAIDILSGVADISLATFEDLQTQIQSKTNDGILGYAIT